MRRLLCVLLVLLPVTLWAALPASDNFNRASAGSLGANWTDAMNGFDTQGDSAVGENGGDYNAAFWNADTFAVNHYSESVLNPVAAVFPGVGCHMSGTGGSAAGYFYMANLSGSSSRISKISAGVVTQLEGGLGDAALSDTLSITCEGNNPTTIKAYLDGVQQGSTQTDSDADGGAPGLVSFGNGGFTTSWIGDDLGGAAAPSCRMLLLGVGC